MLGRLRDPRISKQPVRVRCHAETRAERDLSADGGHTIDPSSASNQEALVKVPM